jgi:hypothetical protein
MSGQFEIAKDALDFVLGGRAVFTATSAKTGKHFTYRVNRKGPDSPFFVGVLSGHDNAADYQYIGFISHQTLELVAGRKGKPDAPSFKALNWALRHLVERDGIPDDLTLQHEGRCCRCARLLTHPESLSTGIGPECAKKGGL